MDTLTYRQFIADIQTEIKQISSDSYIPPRFVYSEAQSIIADFLKKDNDAKKRLFSLEEGWTVLEGIELEEVPVISCADIDVRLCDKMMKSVKKIPKTYTYSYGNIIKHVSSPNFAYFFEPTTPRKWKNIQNQEYKQKGKYYFFLTEGHLYIPIPKGVSLAIEQVRMEAYFIDKHEVELFKKKGDCYDCKDIDDCKSPMDYEIVCPLYLIDSVKKELLNRLAKIFVQVQEDPYPNLNNLQKDSRIDKQPNG